MSEGQHTPPQYIVRELTIHEDDTTSDEFSHAHSPEEAMATAKEIASRNPGAFVDIYHLAFCVRARPPEQPE